MRYILLLLALLLPVRSEAIILIGFGGGAAPTAIAHGNDSSGQATNSATSYTLSHNLSAASGNNRLLIVGVSLDLSGSPTLSCTYNGTAMTALTAAYINGMQVRLFYLLDADLPASAGSYNIVCSSTQAGYLKIIASDFTGVDQAAPDDSSTATAATPANDVSVDVTVSVANSLVWAYSANSTSSALWDGHRATATTVVELEGGDAHIAVATYEIVSGTGDATFADSVRDPDDGNMAIVGASFAPAS